MNKTIGHFLVIATILTTSATASHSRDMKCIPAPASTAKNVKADISAKVEGLKQVVKSASFSAQAGVVTADLYSKYPNSDKLIVAQAFLSQVCSLLNSLSVSDREKLAKYAETELLVFKLASGNSSGTKDEVKK